MAAPPSFLFEAVEVDLAEPTLRHSLPDEHGGSTQSSLQDVRNKSAESTLRHSLPDEHGGSTQLSIRSSRSRSAEPTLRPSLPDKHGGSTQSSLQDVRNKSAESTLRHSLPDEHGGSTQLSIRSSRSRSAEPTLRHSLPDEHGGSTQLSIRSSRSRSAEPALRPSLPDKHGGSTQSSLQDVRNKSAESTLRHSLPDKHGGSTQSSLQDVRNKSAESTLRHSLPDKHGGSTQSSLQDVRNKSAESTLRHSLPDEREGSTQPSILKKASASVLEMNPGLGILLSDDARSLFKQAFKMLSRLLIPEEIEVCVEPPDFLERLRDVSRGKLFYPMTEVEKRYIIDLRVLNHIKHHDIIRSCVAGPIRIGRGKEEEVEPLSGEYIDPIGIEGEEKKEVELLSDEYIDEVVGLIRREIKLFPSIAIDLDATCFGSMRELGMCFAPLYYSIRDLDGKYHPVRDHTSVAVEILKAGLDAISDRVGDQGSTYVQGEAEASELYDHASAAVDAKYKELVGRYSTQAHGLSLGSQ